MKNSNYAQGAAERLKQGAELLSKRLEQDDNYYLAAAELQKHWKLRVSLQESPLCTTAPAILANKAGAHIGSHISQFVSDLACYPPWKVQVSGALRSSVAEWCWSKSGAGT